MAKTICQCQYTKKNRSRKNGDKDGKALFKLMNNAVYGKTMENLRNRIDVKLINNEEDYLKCTAKPSYMPHKIFGNNSVGIRKNKLELKLTKPACIGMRVLELSKSINKWTSLWLH